MPGAFVFTLWKCKTKNTELLSFILNMVLPFTSNTNNTNNGEPPRILTEEEQVLLVIDQTVHEVNRLWNGLNIL